MLLLKEFSFRLILYIIIIHLILLREFSFRLILYLIIIHLIRKSLIMYRELKNIKIVSKL